MAHFEDFELVRSIYRALQDLRSRKTSATVLELDAIPAQAHSPELAAPGQSLLCNEAGRTPGLRFAVSLRRPPKSERGQPRQPNKVIDIGPLWSVAWTALWRGYRKPTN